MKTHHVAPASSVVKIIIKCLLAFLLALAFAYVASAQTLISEGFEESGSMPSGWAKSTTSGNSWTGPYSSASFAHTGSYCMYCFRPYTGSDDSWLYSTGVSLTSGTQYYLEFYARSYSSTDYQVLHATIGEGQTEAAQSTVLVNLPAFASSTYVKQSKVFTVASSGTYNVAFNDLTSTTSGSSYSFIDDVTLRVAIVPDNAPTSFVANVANTTVTVQWTDNSTNETAFRVYRSTDGTTYTQVGSDIASSTTAGTGTTYSQVETGLSPFTTYYYKIVSVADVESTSALTGTATTGCGVVISTGTFGAWSSPTTWNTGVVPTANDSVVIAYGTYVQVDVTTATCYKLTDTGVLWYDYSTTGKALSVGKDVYIASNGALLSSELNPSAATTHSLTVGGSFTNNGYVDFHYYANSYVALTFTGSSNASFTTASGTTTNLNTVTVNKGSDATSVLNFSPGAAFTVNSSSSNGFLTLTNGTFEISGSATMSNAVFAASPYTIGSTTGFWLNNANFTVTGDAGNHTSNGLFRLSNGTFNVGTSSANTFYSGTNAKYIIEGGTMNITGSLQLRSDYDTMIQSGGTINFVTGGSVNESFELGVGTNTYHEMSGGAMYFIKACTGSPYDIDFNNIHATTVKMTGGAVYIGNSSTPSGSNFYVTGTVYDFYIDGTNTGKTCYIYYGGTAHSFTVNHYMLINSPSTFDVNYGNFYFRGDTMENDGAVNGPWQSYAHFYGDTQVYMGSGTFGTSANPFGNSGEYGSIGILESNSFTIASTNQMITNRVNFFGGTINNSGKLKIGTGGSTLQVMQMGGANVDVEGFDAAPDYSSLGTGGFILYYYAIANPFTTSYEIPSSREVLNCGIYANDSGVTLAGGDLDIEVNFFLQNTIVNTDSADKILVEATSAFIQPGDSLSYVNGPFAIQVDSATDVSRTYPTGKGGKYRPVTINNFNSGGTLQTYIAEAENGYCGGTMAGASMDSACYYRIQNTTNIYSTTTAEIQLRYDASDHASPIASEVVAQAGSEAGEYFSIGQSGTSDTTVTSGISITPGSDYFVLANSNVALGTWLGVVSSDWSNTENWSWSVVPNSSITAIIPAGTPYAPIIYSGSFDVDSLKIASGVTVTINSGSALNVKGALANNGYVAGDGEVNMDGSAAQMILGNCAISNLEIDNTSGVSQQGGDTTFLTGVLTLTNGTFNTSDALELVSTASGTASIGTITGGSISGNVIVQQYIPGGRRAFRFFGHPFSASIPLSQMEASIDITGHGGSANGFTTTGTNNPSAFWYNTYTGDGSTVDDSTGWIPFTSTEGAGVNAWNQYEGIRMLVRGEKGEGLWGGTYTPSAVTYSLIGSVNTGSLSVPMHMGDSSAYSLLSNPYPSPTDIGTVIYNASIAGSVGGAAFWVWDANQAAKGAYVPVVIDGTPYVLEQNAAFEVISTADGATLNFAETNKNTSATSSLFKTTSAGDYVLLHLYDSSYNSWDRLFVRFNDAAADSLENYDATKPHNGDLDFYAISSNGRKLCVDTRPYVNDRVIPLGIATDALQTYVIKAETFHIPVGGHLYLHDKYLGATQLLAEGSTYTFSITSDTASQGNNRFELNMEMDATGIATLSNTMKLDIAPNPAVHNVNIIYNSREEHTSIKLLNMAGETLLSREANGKEGTETISVDGLPAGIYFVQLTAGTNTVTRKLVKE